MDSPHQHDPRRLHGDHQLVDHPDLAAGDLPRDRHQSLVGRQRGLPAVALAGLPPRDRGAGDQPRPSRRHQGACGSTTSASPCSPWRRCSSRWIPITGAPARCGSSVAARPGRGGAMLFANSSAILVDAFPSDQRGMAMGINQVAAIGGSFIGLIAGGLLVRSSTGASSSGSRCPSASSVRSGATTACATTASAPRPRSTGGATSPSRSAHVDPRRHRLRHPALLHHSMGWTSPRVLVAFLIGVVFLVAFFIIENRVVSPMFNLRLFKMRAFSTGSAAGFPGGHLARRPAVHAHHLAAGHLVAAHGYPTPRRRCGPASTSCR